MDYRIPSTQYAVQLVGPDELTLNKAKPVAPPGPTQILCRVEAVGLCFSDLKLLKQFSQHARKTEIISGIDPAILGEIPSYAPGEKPTVPGHESVVRVWAVGERVERFKPGERYLVQTDYRWLPTANSNASYGYNFEGGLQEFVLMDERIITSPQGQSMLIPASEKLSAAAIGLVEPWACVEDSYVAAERTTLKAEGQMLVFADAEVNAEAFGQFLHQHGAPARITWLGSSAAPANVDIPVSPATRLDELNDGAFDDVIYFGSNPETVETLFPKVAPQGLFNIVLCGGTLGRDVTSYVGRVHYGGIRIIGTVTSDAGDSMKTIPASGEIRTGDTINVIGAAGPMGVMHVIRNICQGVDDITILAGDLDDNRRALLDRIAVGLAGKNQVNYRSYNPAGETLTEPVDYVVLMAPVPKLVVDAIKTAADHAIINIFAGIAAPVTAAIDLQRYIEKRMYFIGTSGSTLNDMNIVLQKVESGRLDTNISVAAISGPDGAVEGIRAVEKQLIPGKIIVYPQCKGLGLIRLDELPEKLPEVAKALNDSVWNVAAEKKLLEEFKM